MSLFESTLNALMEKLSPHPECQRNMVNHDVISNYSMKNCSRPGCRPSMSKMKKLLLSMGLLQAGCFNIGGVNWHDEQAKTHWAGYNTIAQSNARVSKFKLHGYSFSDGKIVTITRLNKEGIHVMETEGCMGCHQEGGLLPSALLVERYSSPDILRSADQQVHEIVSFKQSGWR